MTPPTTRQCLTSADRELERRKQLAESLIQKARDGLAAMRDALEPCDEPAGADGNSAPGNGEPQASLTGDASGNARDRLHAVRSGAVEAILQRDVALAALVKLDALLAEDTEAATNRNTKSEPTRARVARFFGLRTAPAPLRAAGHVAWTDLETLQAFRRAAVADLERLESDYARRCAGPWRSGADERREQAVRRYCLRWGAALGVAAALMAGWWGWQWSRQETARKQVNLARSQTAAQAVRLVSLAGRLAQKAQGKTLGDIAPDMSEACAGIDVQKIYPNHPCREAWAASSHALFRASIPAPGKPVDAPSEIFSDPWGAPYVLLIPASGPGRIVCAGPDGRVGTPDDVAADIPSWSPNQPN